MSLEHSPKHLSRLTLASVLGHCPISYRTALLAGVALKLPWLHFHTSYRFLLY